MIQGLNNKPLFLTFIMIYQNVIAHVLIVPFNLIQINSDLSK
jgi:hypothetical protein